MQVSRLLRSAHFASVGVAKLNASRHLGQHTALRMPIASDGSSIRETTARAARPLTRPFASGDLSAPVAAGHPVSTSRSLPKPPFSAIGI